MENRKYVKKNCVHHNRQRTTFQQCVLGDGLGKIRSHKKLGVRNPLALTSRTFESLGPACSKSRHRMQEQGNGPFF